VVSSLSAEYAPETVAKSVRLIRVVLGKVVQHQRLTRSPAALLDAPRVPKREMRILTAEEVAAVAGALPDRYRSVPIVVAYMGRRFWELAGMKVSAVDMLRRRLEVRQVLEEPPRTRTLFGTAEVDGVGDQGVGWQSRPDLNWRYRLERPVHGDPGESS